MSAAKAWNRRTIVNSLAGAAIGASCGVRLARAVEGDRPRRRYIDIHTHIGTFYWGKPLTVDGLLALMDRHGIEKACILPLVSPEAGPYPQTSEQAIEAASKHPDRLIPFCCIDPRCLTEPPARVGHVAGYDGLRDMLKKYQDVGCRGLGEHKTGLPFDHDLNMTLYRACEEVGLPILFHLDDIRNPDKPGLPRLDAALTAFPKLPLIGHAAGFWASISGAATLADFGRYPDLPKPVAPGGALDALMDKHPNLYGDLSEPGGYSAIARDKKFGREFLIRRADRLLFGTDYLMNDQPIPHYELFDALELPDDVQAKIYRDNAIRLLKLEA